MGEEHNKKFKKDMDATVHYWAGRGRCEQVRLVLAAGGHNMHNNFLKEADDLDKLRPKCTYGQVPLVEINGKRLVQSLATMNYIARISGLYPSDFEEAYLVDETVQGCNDCRTVMLSYPWHSDKDKVKTSFNFQRYPKKWNELLEGKKYLLGDKMSLADVTIFEVLDAYRDIFGDETMKEDFSAYPQLLKHFELVGSNPGIAKWIITRRKVFSTFPEYRKAVDATLRASPV